MVKPEQFVADFVRPLVGGGAVQVSAPLGRAGLEKLREAELPPSVLADVAVARAAIANDLLVDAVPPQLDLEAMRLAVAVHDLLFLFHPRAEGLAVRDARLEEVARFAAACARLPDTRDTDALVARHTMLHLLPGLGRTDVEVTFWVGRRQFHGEEPPRRLLAWPNLRRVRQERTRVSCFAEAASHPLGGPVVRALLDGSPLTDLLHPVRLEPKLALGPRVALLADPTLCRLVAYAYLEEGIERVGGAVAGAVLAELDGSSTANARFACAFLAHLHLCMLLAPQAPREPQPSRFPVGGDPALRDFYGLFAALERTSPDLAAPADVRGDARLARRLAAHAATCAATAGPQRITELSALVARAGGPLLISQTG